MSPLISQSQSTDSMFCRSLVSAGYLSQEQMQQAAQRYFLGKSREGGVVFWLIDDEQVLRDGKVMWYGNDCHRLKDKNPTWVSTLLKQKDELPASFDPKRCLFGLHLLHAPLSVDKRSDEPPTVCIVEAEKTAVICSALFPQCLWMAPGGLTMLNAAKLYPLREHKVILFPDTDETGQTYEEWSRIAQSAQDSFTHPIRVSPLLEKSATLAQKSAKIDIVDLMFSSPKP